MTRTIFFYCMFVSFIAINIFTSSDSFADQKTKILAEINDPFNPNYPRKMIEVIELLTELI